MGLYRICMQAFLLQENSWQCYLNQNIGPAVARSAGPALPPLLCYDLYTKAECRAETLADPMHVV